MKFQFRFATILQLRRRERDEVGQSVGKANAAIHQIDLQRDSIELERQNLRTDSADQRIGEISIDKLLSSGRYDLQLQAQLYSLAQTRAELVQELERRQSLLAAAEAEVKRFERLEEQDRSQYIALQSKREQAELDEMSSRRHSMIRRR